MRRGIGNPNMNRRRGEKIDGGGGGRGGGNTGGPLLTAHLRDLDMELQLLKRKRQIFEQEQNMLDRFSNNTTNFTSYYNDQYSSNNYSNNSNRRQYDNKQPFYAFNQQGPSEPYPSAADYSNAYEPSNSRSQGIKRQPVWENQIPSPPKRFNAPQRVNPWQNQDMRQDYRAVNQYPYQPKNFSPQIGSLMNQRPGIGQRIRNRYNPPVDRKNFKPSKVTKPNQTPVTRANMYRPSEQTKKLIEETNKLIANTNKIVSIQNPPSQLAQNPSPKAVSVKKKLNRDNILRPHRQPFGQMKGRLELALGMIVKSVKELCPDPTTLEFFMLPFIQRVIKYTIRMRIKNVMMNEPIESVTDVLDKYRQKYPRETDIELMKIAQDADDYNRKNRGFLQLIETDNPEEFFRKNFNKILHNKLEDVFADLRTLTVNKKYNMVECVEKFAIQSEESYLNRNVKKSTDGTTGEKETVGERDNTEEKEADDAKYTDGEDDMSEENNTDELQNADGNIDTNGDKDTEGVKETSKKKDTTIIKPNAEKVYSVDVKNIEEQLEVKSARTQHYVDFVEKLIEQRLPIILPRFKETIMAILCTNKEFISAKASIVLGMKERMRKILEVKKKVNQDGADTSATAKPAAAKTTAKPATAAAAKPATPKKPTTTTAKKPLTPSKTASTPVIPAKTTVKPAAAPASPATPVKEAEKSVPSTPSTPASKDIHYVKLIGRPALPARAVIYEFLSTFKPASIKKHKSINNLLVIGFTDKEEFEKILAASESVVGDVTIIITASEQVPNMPVQNKTGQQGNKTPVPNKATEQVNKTPQSKNTEQEKAEVPSAEKNTTPAPQDKTKDNEQNNTSTHDILSELDTEITDLLSSIRKADEEEKTDPNTPKKSTDEKMITDTELDNEIAELTKESDDRKADLDRKKFNDANANQNLDTTMEVDDEAKQVTAIDEVAKTAKESGRATPTRSSSRLVNVTPSTIKTRRASRLAYN